MDLFLSVEVCIIFLSNSEELDIMHFKLSPNEVEIFANEQHGASVIADTISD